MQNEGVGADVSSYHQPPTIHLLTKSPDVNGQRSQVSTCWDENIRQEDRTAKVQRDEATSSWGGKDKKYPQSCKWKHPTQIRDIEYVQNDKPECIRSIMMDWCGGGCRKWEAWEIAKARPLPMEFCGRSRIITQPNPHS